MTEIPLRNRVGVVIALALVDDEFSFLALKAWFIRNPGNRRRVKSPHVRRDERIPGTRKKRRLYLHREIMHAPAELEVDHLDGDPLNCRRANLECVTPAENTRRRNERHGNPNPHQRVTHASGSSG